MTPENKLRLDAYEKNRQKEKSEKDQRFAIGDKLVNKKQNAHNRSYNAINDDYMKNAMKQIRSDKRTHSDDLTMFNGSYLHSKSSS